MANRALRAPIICQSEQPMTDVQSQAESIFLTRGSRRLRRARIAERHRSVDDERGAVIIEFAMLAPVLLMISLGIFQVSLLLFQQQALHSAAREGARIASIPTSSVADIESAATDAMVGVTFASTPTVTLTPDDGAPPCQDRATLPVTVDLATSTRLDIPFVAGRIVTLTSSATFRCEE